jgi:hypothetical protein
MKSSTLLPLNLEPRRKAYLLGAVIVGVIVTSLFVQNLTAYYLIVIPAIVPVIMWLRAGAAGLPVMAIISALYFVYYAIPLLRSDIVAYGSDALISAAAVVGSFLIAASATSWPFLLWPRRDDRMSAQNVVSDRQLVRLVFIGLAGGILYNLAQSSEGLNWLGTSLGLVRSIVLTLTSVACYLLGCARASGILANERWALALASLFALIIFSLSNLLLVGGVMNGLAAILGYVITAKRIPWIGLGLAFAMLSILHAGKFEMRKAYWVPHTQTLERNSIVQIPGMMVDWVAMGISALENGGQESTVLERTSLLHMLLFVQRTTPGYIPYLDGQTYAMLPSMLVPRFVDPDKPESQSVLNLLSMRYGLQYAGSAASTTIGWGVVAEAYANYGVLAVVLVGALFGVLCGVLTRISVGAPPLSLPMFISIASTLVLFNVELDFSYLMVALAQTLAAVLACAMIPHLIKGRRRIAAAPRAAPFEMDGPRIGDAPPP